MKKILQKLMPKLYGKILNVYVLISPKKAADMAFRIFCKVRKGKILPHQKEYLDPVKLQKTEIAGHSIQTYQWKGDKETVLLVHGWESNAWRWHKLIEKLTEANYNVIAFDAPAHGNSSGTYLYVPLYAEVTQYMIKKYKPKFLIGHSMGGMTILYNEFLNKNVGVEKIITIGSPSEFHEIINHFKKLLGFNDSVLNALEQYIVQRFGFTINEFSSSRFIENDKRKGLLFHDRFDKIAPYHASEKVHSDWKGSQLVTTEGLGHSMHQDEVNDKIIAFLKDA
ncbi:alpha/beta hydrolase [Maribacter sp. MMG018]|uniref:alpha/beta hydrolase n=1 Tax=Maribacter sp. MMG018 TaxID=2822688 RepID=UPI001B36B794|nr:alpha/beta hydrolase [Maribacter sp. MMG018]MBQ4914159.1 alpha/beta hydrolase [Maribacter sp. MMG018]